LAIICISSSSVSEITKSLNVQVNKYHARRLVDDYVYLIADGVYFNVKNPVWKKRRCVLVVYGIKSNGTRELIDFELAPHGESQIAWERFLYRLYNRGLEGNSLRLIVRDGNKGLKNALANVFLNAPQQPCWAHKLRNVSNKLPRKLQSLCINQARDIYNASDSKTALKTFKSWAKTWQPIAPKAVTCLNEDIFDLLNFFNEPEHMWKKLRTSNIIERCFREVRRRTRPMSCFQNSESVQRIIYAIFYRQNKIWENKTLKLLHNS
jgi:putative transposase